MIAIVAPCASVNVTACLAALDVLITCDTSLSTTCILACKVFTAWFAICSVYATPETSIKLTWTVYTSTFLVSTSCYLRQVCCTRTQVAWYVLLLSDKILICYLSMRCRLANFAESTVWHCFFACSATFCRHVIAFLALTSVVGCTSVFLEDRVSSKWAITLSILDAEEVFTAFGAGVTVWAFETIVQECAWRTDVQANRVLGEEVSFPTWLCFFEITCSTVWDSCAVIACSIKESPARPALEAFISWAVFTGLIMWYLARYTSSLFDDTNRSISKMVANWAIITHIELWATVACEAKFLQAILTESIIISISVLTAFFHFVYISWNWVHYSHNNSRQNEHQTHLPACICLFLLEVSVFLNQFVNIPFDLPLGHLSKWHHRRLWLHICLR